MKQIKPLLILITAIMVLFYGCKKEDPEQQPPIVTVPTEIKSNVHVIDSTLMSIDYSASDLSNGIYVFNTTGTPPTLMINDVIVGAQGEGYIRKITSVSNNGTVITMQTTQGTMEDVFSEASFSFNIDMNDMNPGKTSGLSYDVSNVTLYSNSALDIKLLNGSVAFDPNWFFDFKFTADGGITNFEMSTANTSYSATAQIQMTASQAINLFDDTDTIKSYTKLVTKWVPAGALLIPVVFRIDADWIVHSSADLDAAVSSTVNFHTSASDLNLGAKFSNDQWQGIHSVNPTTTYDITSPEGQISLAFNYAVEPVISVKLYGIAGPYASVGLLTESEATVSLPSLDWDLHSEAWLKGAAGLRADLDVNLDVLCIFGDGSINIHEDFRDSIESTHKVFDAPSLIQAVSGNNQSGTPALPLTNPIKIKVKNSAGIAQQGVPVYFNIISGGGSLNHTSILSDQNGNAEAYWTLGAVQGGQTLQVSAKNGSGDLLSGAPLTFNATNTELCNGSLAVSESRSGKTITASATGGTAPYQYKFANGWTSQDFSTDNIYDLEYNGDYTVIVKDANNCTDTVRNCINDVVLDSVRTSDWNGAVRLLRISYHSPLGLHPEFLRYISANDNYGLQLWTVTGGNSTNYPPDVSAICSAVQPGCATTFQYTFPFSYSGPATQRTVFMRITGDINTPTSISMRFYQSSCSTVWHCGSECFDNWSNEYTVTW